MWQDKNGFVNRFFTALEIALLHSLIDFTAQKALWFISIMQKKKNFCVSSIKSSDKNGKRNSYFSLMSRYRMSITLERPFFWFTSNIWHNLAPAISHYFLDRLGVMLRIKNIVAKNCSNILRELNYSKVLKNILLCGFDIAVLRSYTQVGKIKPVVVCLSGKYTK